MLNKKVVYYVIKMDSDVQDLLISQLRLQENSEEMLEMVFEFRRLMTMYDCAIKEVKTKCEVLNEELSVARIRNPIQFIQSRVKKPVSIMDKIKRQGLPFSLDAISENLNDVAGIRVICSFIDDIYEIADMLSKQDDVTVLQVKDYIKNPKQNGYRSYHMIVEVPVFFSNKKQPMRVEVQLRTIAMDFWASLEHDLKYKKTLDDLEIIGDELKECADVISKMDIRMQEIQKQITGSAYRGEDSV